MEIELNAPPQNWGFLGVFGGRAEARPYESRRIV